jgi:hypothetical protein
MNITQVVLLFSEFIMQAAASSARGGQVPPEADKFRQRRTSSTFGGKTRQRCKYIYGEINSIHVLEFQLPFLHILINKTTNGKINGHLLFYL